MVLATDGSLSFIFFIYIDINWGGSTQLGFNAGDGIHSFTLHEAFNFTAIRNLASTSNVDIPGFYLFRVDSQQILRPIGKPKKLCGCRALVGNNTVTVRAQVLLISCPDHYITL